MAVQKRVDLATTIADLQKRVATLEKASTLTSASIGSGGLTIRNQGDLTIKDGGGLIIEDGGDVHIADGGDLNITGGGSMRARSPGEMQWLDEEGRVRVEWGTGTEPVTGTRLQAFNFLDKEGNGRATLGELVDFDTGSVRIGILVEDSLDRDLLYVGPGEASLRQWNASGESFGVRVFKNLGETFLSGGAGNGIRMLGTDPGIFFFRRVDDNATGLKVEIDTPQTHLVGGFTGSGLATRLILRSDFEVQVKDGADSTYLDIAASAFVVRPSTSKSKNITGTVKRGSREKVTSVPIKKWTYKTHPATDKGERQEIIRDRIGPVVEDCPPELISKSEGGDEGIDLSASLWTLWAAFQEQTELVETMQARIEALESAVEHLTKGTIEP